MEVFLRYRIGGGNIWRGLFSEFYGIRLNMSSLLGFLFSQIPDLFWKDDILSYSYQPVLKITSFHVMAHKCPRSLL